VGGYLWLRDSSLVAVDKVEVSGLTTSDAPRIRAALKTTALGMTTLHVRADQLRSATAPFAVVEGLQIETNFPHGLRIHVIEHAPIIALLVAGRRIAVAADGIVLRGVAEPNLPELRVSTAPAGNRIHDPVVLRMVRVLQAAPPALRRRARHVADTKRGLAVGLRAGPTVYLGSYDQLAAKWAAAARVLADPASRGATYVDVRLPERPAAGGLGAAGAQPPPPDTQTPGVPGAAGTTTAPGPAATAPGTTAGPAAGTTAPAAGATPVATPGAGITPQP
jgi:cell division protein FtsQ